MASPALDWDQIKEIFASPNSDIRKLYRALFCIRTQCPSIRAAVKLLLGSLGLEVVGGTTTVEKRIRGDTAAAEKSPAEVSCLFRHECCYLLGQIGGDLEGEENADSLLLIQQGLTLVLDDAEEDEVTRHEAAEGVAAVYSERGTTNPTKRELLIEMLNRYAVNIGTPLGDTCYLAIEGLKRNRDKVCACQYASHDPAIGDPLATVEDIARHAELLKDGQSPLYERYVSMFTLRNLKTEECVQALVQVLADDVSSPVLRHEIAFVLGQIENEVACAALISNLNKEEEHAMVRHESAIALGSIGGELAKHALKLKVDDADQMVAESCQVALDTIAYWEAWEELEKRLSSQ